MARFDYEVFINEYNYRYMVGFDAKKYTEQQALEIAAIELDKDIKDLKIEPTYVYYGYGTMDDERRNGYWLTYEPKGNAIKAWAVTEKEG